MAQYTERLWTQTKDTEQLTFIAGVDLPYRELVKESGPNTNIMVVATTVDAIGYVLSPKGVLAGEKVDVQMLYGSPGGGGGSGVQSVTGLDTDNTDPANPIVNIAVDGVTITGTGYPGDPLVAVGGGGGSVNSVTGLAPNVSVDNTDPTNPIVTAGTESWEFSGKLTTPVLNNIQNNYTQAGMADISTLRVLGDLFDPPFFTGIAGGTDGRFLIIHNASPDTPIFFFHDDTNSLPENRILIPGFSVPGQQLMVPINGMLIFQYDNDDQRWRMIYKAVQSVVDSGTGVVSVDNTDPLNPVVGFNGVFVNAPITGNGTAFSPLTVPPTSDVLENITFFVDPVYGNDGTAIQDSRSLKYQNIDTALSLASLIANAKVYLMPGNHVVSTPHSIDEVLNIDMSPGSTLISNSGSTSFNISPGKKLYITGEGQIQFVSILFANSTPSSSSLPEVVIRAKSLDSSGASDIGDISSMLFSIECDSINDLRLSGTGYSKGHVATDFWQSSAGGKLLLRDFTQFDGESKYDQNGPQEITIKGRTRARCKFFSSQALSNGIYTETGVQSYKTKINLHVDYDTTDCIGFMNPGRGIIRHWGNLIHRKTDLAGNEMPWFYMNQDIESDELKPVFEHVDGNYVSGTNSVFAGSQNNEIFSVQKLCEIILNGSYQNSGEDTGFGPWPILLMSNQNANPGETVVILNGYFKSLGDDVSPIKYVDGSNVEHTFKIINKTSSIQTKATYSIDTNIDFKIYNYHSLCMNKNYNPLISDGLSEDRTIVDSNITVYVPEYGS